MKEVMDEEGDILQLMKNGVRGRSVVMNDAGNRVGDKY